MSAPAPCSSTWRHDLYSCPMWLGVLADGGRPAAFEVDTSSARLTIHTRLPTNNPRYARAHLLRELDVGLPELWYVGPLSGYRTEPQWRATGDGVGPLDAALRTGAELAAQAGCGIVSPFLPETLRPSAALGGVVLFEETEYWLRPGDSLEDYLASLSAHRRTAVRRELKTFASSGAHITVVPLARHVGAFAELTVADSIGRHERADRADMAEFLERIAAAFGDEAVLMAAYLNARLAGAVLAIRHGGDLWLRMTGFSSDLEGTFAYFVLTYYAVSLLNNELTVADVHLGVGAGEAKRHRGARSETLVSWLKLPGITDDCLAVLAETRVHQPVPADRAVADQQPGRRLGC